MCVRRIPYACDPTSSLDARRGELDSDNRYVSKRRTECGRDALFARVRAGLRCVMLAANAVSQVKSSKQMALERYHGVRSVFDACAARSANFRGCSRSMSWNYHEVRGHGDAQRLRRGVLADCSMMVSRSLTNRSRSIAESCSDGVTDAVDAMELVLGANTLDWLIFDQS